MQCFMLILKCNKIGLKYVKYVKITSDTEYDNTLTYTEIQCNCRKEYFLSL